MTAALEVFAERGFAATRLDEVAKRAGVSKGTIYLYFDSKEALFKAAVESAIIPALEAGEAIAADPAKSPGEALREFVFWWWEKVGSTDIGALPKLLVAEIGNFPELGIWFHENMIQRGKRAVVGIIARGVASGDFRPVEPLGVARIVFAMMFSYVLWRRALGAAMPDLPEPEDYFEQALDLLTHGLKRTPPCA
ncbi:MAG: TetR/AcrR family transcriptional regulator [Gammaproteobacteria bacterium]|nr:TetR/AcrR family transcriptional regulator [Gammaproteobacteria bacterium]MBU1416208.1 TetR/AcrR family transcriptional regulator [Gammaproteobacteria bacterium]